MFPFNLILFLSLAHLLLYVLWDWSNEGRSPTMKKAFLLSLVGFAGKTQVAFRKPPEDDDG